jgi:hypothetical protein
MADDPSSPNSLSPGARDPSVQAGDVPSAVRRRYYTDGGGGPGLGFYVDATVTVPAFRDRGRQLETPRADPNAIRDMVSVARHRGWTIVVARGSAEFRREAWLAGRRLGLEVRGYRPTERDLQELERRMTRRRDREDASVHSRLRVVETVVRNRVDDPATQDRILAAARSRIADWLERGARFEPFRIREVDGEPRAARSPQRDRGR